MIKYFCATLITVLFSLTAAPAHAATEEHLSDYYTADLWQSMKSLNIQDDELRGRLFKVISRDHHAVGYDEARRQIFGRISLQQNGSEYFVTDVYCEKNFGSREYPQLGFGPGSYPSNGDIINTEHTWPQSRFTKRHPNGTQKSDMHHLFPTDSKMNSHRSALQFGEVGETVENLKCPIAKLGHDLKGGRIVFEPPTAHKGNVARAILYFATRYEMIVSDNEENYLRKWNLEDPVDAEEIRRNDEVEKVQGNRNPFIDVPALIDQIHNF